MSWFSKSLKGLTDPQALGESVIERQESNYSEFLEVNPDVEPHHMLLLLYLTRISIFSQNPPSQVRQAEGLAKTCEYACLPFPENVRALGIAFIQSECPEVLQRCPGFERQYRELMNPVYEARKRGELDQLYRRYNPTLAAILLDTENSQPHWLPPPLAHLLRGNKQISMVLGVG